MQDAQQNPSDEADAAASSDDHDSTEHELHEDPDPRVINDGDRVRATATLTVTGEVNSIEQYPDDACASVIDEDGDTTRLFYDDENGWDIEGHDATLRVIREDRSEDETPADDLPEDVQNEQQLLDRDEAMAEAALADLNRTEDPVLAQLACDEADRADTDVTAIYGPNHDGGIKHGYSLHAYRRPYGNAVVVAQYGLGDPVVYTGEPRHVLSQMQKLVDDDWHVEEADFALRLDD